MINVWALKNEHPLYVLLRSALSEIDIDYNLHFIGMDIPSSITNTGVRRQIETIISAKEKFFIYLEEPNTFAGDVSAGREPDKQLVSIDKSFYDPIVNNPNFLGFISHLRITCSEMYKEYQSICYHLPLFSEEKDFNRIQKRIDSMVDNNRPINIINWMTWGCPRRNSANWSSQAISDHYRMRGNGVSELIIKALLESNHNITYTTRTHQDMSSRLDSFPNRHRINDICKFLEQDELDEVFYSGDIFMLHADQIRSLSSIYAMSFGMPCVIFDTWGTEELFKDNFNAIVSKADDSGIEDSLTRVSRLINNREQLKVMSMNCINNFRIRHNKKEYIQRLARIIEISKEQNNG